MLPVSRGLFHLIVPSVFSSAYVIRLVLILFFSFFFGFHFISVNFIEGIKKYSEYKNDELLHIWRQINGKETHFSEIVNMSTFIVNICCFKWFNSL